MELPVPDSVKNDPELCHGRSEKCLLVVCTRCSGIGPGWVLEISKPLPALDGGKIFFLCNDCKESFDEEVVKPSQEYIAKKHAANN